LHPITLHCKKIPGKTGDLKYAFQKKPEELPGTITL
jgi:hypothetical protein